MARREFTEERVAALPHRGKRYEVFDGSVLGFSIVVGLRDKSFAYRYRHGGKSHKLTFPYLGPGFDSLEMARQKAREARAKVKQGIDPRPSPALPTILQHSNNISDVLEQFLSKHVTKRTGEPLRQSTVERRRQALIGATEGWRTLDIGALSKRHIRELIDGHIANGNPAMARHVLQHIKTFLAWCVERDIIPTSPAAGIRSLPAARSVGRALTEQELIAIWGAAGTLGYPFGSMVQLLLLTGQRRQEAALLRWEHIEKGAWTQPESVTKNGKKHLVPLSPQATSLLDSLPRERPPWVFAPHGFGLTSNYPDGKRELDRLLPLGMLNWRIHDLRHTLKTWMQQARIPKDVRDAVQNHSVAGMEGTYGHYTYLAEKAEALGRWGLYIEGICKPATAPSKVVSLSGRK